MVEASESATSLSVVIPTHNRAETLRETLDRSLRCAAGLDIEFLVIDDGSSDHTREVVASFGDAGGRLRFESLDHGGPGRARNRGAALATKDAVLFLGDDIQPVDGRTFAAHAEYHTRHPALERAMLGNVVWPQSDSFPVNFVMAHVAGEGGEQFGFAHLEPGQRLDWRFFYTANVSVKRAIVDWEREGFDTRFHAAAWEDIELAYRLAKSGRPLQLVFSTDSVGTHHHPFSVQSFLDRQERAGAMAATFVRIHPEAARGIGVATLNKRLERSDAHLDHAIGDFLAVTEGVCAWARLLERGRRLGSRPWHTELLRAVFRVRFLEGYLTAPETEGNLAAGYQYVLEELDTLLAAGAREHLSPEVGEALAALRDPSDRWRAWVALLKERVKGAPGVPRVRARLRRMRAWSGRP